VRIRASTQPHGRVEKSITTVRRPPDRERTVARQALATKATRLAVVALGHLGVRVIAIRIGDDTIAIFVVDVAVEHPRTAARQAHQ
jgi:hypothetical protein